MVSLEVGTLDSEAYHRPAMLGTAMTSESRCIHVKANGQPCRGTPLPGKDCCLFHDPDRARDVRAARKRGGLARSKPRAVKPPDTADLHLECVGDVVAALGDVFNDVRKGSIDPKVGSCLATVAGHLLKAMQASELEDLAAELVQLKAMVAEHANQAAAIGGTGPAPLPADDASGEQSADQATGGPGDDLDGGGDSAGPLAGPDTPLSFPPLEPALFAAGG